MRLRLPAGRGDRARRRAARWSPPACWTAPRGPSRCTATRRCRSGTVGLRTGAITAACDRVDVTLTGPGGHTARPQLTVDLVDALGRLITDLPGAAVPPGRPARRDVAGLGRGQRRRRRQRHPAARPAARHRAGARPGRLARRRGAGALAGRAGRRHHRRRGRGRLRPRACRRWSTTRARSRCCARPRWRPSAPTRVVLSPQSMGGEDFGWFADVLPIALARLGTARRAARRWTCTGAPSTSTSGRSASASGCWPAPRCTPWPPTPAPARTGRRAPGDTSPDEPSTRGGNPTMSSPDRSGQRDRAAPTRRCRPSTRCPTSWRWPASSPPPTREQWRELVAGVLRKAGRERAARPGRGRAAPHGRHRRHRRPALHRRGRRRPARRGRRPRARAVRARRAGPAATRAAGCPPGGTSGSGTPTPTSR